MVLTAAAVVPGPPAFVSELMGSAAAEVDDLRQAADSAVARVLTDLLAVSSDSPAADRVSARLVVVGPGEPREFRAAGPGSFRSFGRDVSVPALVEAEGTDRDLPTPLMVARYLASRDVAAHPEHTHPWASARWITTDGVGELLWRGAPYGVGWAVATRRPVAEVLRA